MKLLCLFFAFAKKGRGSTPLATVLPLLFLGMENSVCWFVNICTCGNFNLEDNTRSYENENLEGGI